MKKKLKMLSYSIVRMIKKFFTKKTYDEQIADGIKYGFSGREKIVNKWKSIMQHPNVEIKDNIYSRIEVHNDVIIPHEEIKI